MSTPDAHTCFADIVLITAALHRVFARWLQELELRVLEARAGEVTPALPVTQRHASATCTLP